MTFEELRKELDKLNFIFDDENEDICHKNFRSIVLPWNQFKNKNLSVNDVVSLYMAEIYQDAYEEGKNEQYRNDGYLFY